jgi:hypothetical protein
VDVDSPLNANENATRAMDSAKLHEVGENSLEEGNTMPPPSSRSHVLAVLRSSGDEVRERCGRWPWCSTRVLPRPSKRARPTGYFIS